MITRSAYAKINLSLEVIGKRKEDSYHDVISVMQLLDLHDTLTFSPAGTLTIETDDPLLARGESNLVWRVACALQEATGVDTGALIELQKRIPIAAGLGGGSSDAAATLLGLCDLWQLQLSREELLNLASGLGSDVPFFLNGPTALVEGRGERVTRIPSPPSGWVVLVCQPYQMADKTRRLYGSLAPQDMTNGNLTRQLISSILDSEFPTSRLLYNAFERSAYTVFDGLQKTRYKIARASGRDVHLSGSGPTLYVLYHEHEANRAGALHETLLAEGLRAFLTRTLRKT